MNRQNFKANLKTVFFAGISAVVLVSGNAGSQELTEEELEKWFLDDTRSHPFNTDVNEGQLELLAKPPEQAVLHSQNRFTITKQSLEDGWVQMHQCYRNLDAVPAMEVVYQYKNLKDLTVASVSGIEKAWVEDQSVQLLNTAKGAVLCIDATVQILYRHQARLYVLKNGPFQRKFLDGYYPMRVTLHVIYPSNLLRYDSVSPPPQKGVKLENSHDSVAVDIWFAGRLFTEINFITINSR
ncbi:hypothetical protein [Kaarinaea lacus]